MQARSAAHRSQRTEGRISVAIACRIEVAGRVLDAHMEDLSMRGARITLPRSPGELGDEITLEVSGARILAQIRYCKKLEQGYVAGLQLQPRTKLERSTLKKLMVARPREKGEGTRAHPRLATRWPVSVDSHGERHAHVVSLSLVGVCVEMDEQMPAGELLRLCLMPAPGHEPLELLAIVRTCRERLGAFHIGCELRNVDNYTAAALFEQMHLLMELGDGDRDF